MSLFSHSHIFYQMIFSFSVVFFCCCFVLFFDRGVEVEDVGSGFSCKNFLRISSSLDSDTRPKNSVFWVTLVCIFSLNMKSYKVSLCIQSKCGKMWTRITPHTGTFHPVTVKLFHAFFVTIHYHVVPYGCQ